MAMHSIDANRLPLLLQLALVPSARKREPPRRHLRPFPPGVHPMSFRSVFLAVVIAFALILSAFLVNRQRPSCRNGPADGRLRPRVRKVRRVPCAASVLGCP